MADKKALSAEQLVLRLKDLVEEEKAKPTATPGARVCVIGVDASTFSCQAVEWGRKNVLRPGDIVVLVTVWEETLEFVKDAGLEMELYGMIQVHHEGIRRHNEDALESARKLLKNMYKQYLLDCDVFPLIVASPSVAKSSIGDLICKTAATIQADMCIVGCRGLGSLKQFFMGSVSKFVLEHAHCPVTVVKF
eukprot:GHVN01078900.1.p1 GENE.GHVN01078900.1~~GHVN01078900.1.p1  ORF type:complete len:192 (+),score=25.58 GHVN01078900.1:142-717(+)